MNVIVETQRFNLRKFTSDDLHNLFELDQDPEVHKYLGNNPVKDIAKSHAYLDSILQQYIDNGFARFAIEDKLDGSFVGWCGLKLEKGVKKEPYNDIGYRLKKEYWGRGIATETALACMRYGFETLNLEKINGGAHIDNVASNVVLQKIGLEYIDQFEYEGMLINWYEMLNPKNI